MLDLETVVRNRREFAAAKAINAIAWDLHVSRTLIGKANRMPEGFRTHKFTSPKRARDCDILNPSRCATVSSSVASSCHSIFVAKSRLIAIAHKRCLAGCSAVCSAGLGIAFRSLRQRQADKTLVWAAHDNGLRRLDIIGARGEENIIGTRRQSGRASPSPVGDHLANWRPRSMIA